MAEATGVKVGPEFPIQPMKDIQVERRGDSIAVIIGGQQSASSFTISVPSKSASPVCSWELADLQDHTRFFRRKVADACADVERECCTSNGSSLAGELCSFEMGCMRTSGKAQAMF